MKINSLVFALLMVCFVQTISAQTTNPYSFIKSRDSIKQEKKIEIATIKGNSYLTYSDKTSVIVKQHYLDQAKDRANQETKLSELLELMKGTNKDNIVTPGNYATILKTKFRTLSGTDIKNGKYAGQSIVIDSKNATANFSIKPTASEFYVNPTISGTAKDNVIDLFSDGKYNKTLTGGVNFVALSNFNRHNFDVVPQNRVNNELVSVQDDYFTLYYDKAKLEMGTWMGEINDILKDTLYAKFISDYQTKRIAYTENDLSKKNVKYKLYKKHIDTLIKAKILPEEFETFSVGEQLTFICDRNYHASDIEQYLKNKFLEKADKIQQEKAKYSIEQIVWFTGGVKYNVAQYQLLDASSDNLKKDFKDEYFSWNLGATWTLLFDKGHRVYISPTVTLKNSHPFDEDNQIHAQSLSAYQVGTTTLQKIDKDLTFYESVPDRVANWAFDLPVVYYSNKWKIGFEAAARKSLKDPLNDNLGLRFGVLIPFNQGDENVVVIEPLLRLIKLNQNTEELWKKNAVFGFNLSVTIPKEIFK